MHFIVIALRRVFFSVHLESMLLLYVLMVLSSLPKAQWAIISTSRALFFNVRFLMRINKPGKLNNIFALLKKVARFYLWIQVFLCCSGDGLSSCHNIFVI